VLAQLPAHGLGTPLHDYVGPLRRESGAAAGPLLQHVPVADPVEFEVLGLGGHRLVQVLPLETLFSAWPFGFALMLHQAAGGVRIHPANFDELVILEIELLDADAPALQRVYVFGGQMFTPPLVLV